LTPVEPARAVEPPTSTAIAMASSTSFLMVKIPPGLGEPQSPTL
jgi:hypothetical protein